MYQNYATIDDVISLLEANHKIVNKTLVNKAYEFAEKKHKGQKRKSEEPYIMHPLRVAIFVADLGFESDVVAAALLHDVCEDTDTPIEIIKDEFGSRVAELVESLTEVNKTLKKASGLSKLEIDKLSDAKFIRSVSIESLFIKIGDRYDNLMTISVMPEAKQLAKAQHTREIIVPLIIKEGSFYLVEKIEDLCFQIEHKERYNQILDKYNSLRRKNYFSAEETVSLFDDLFSQNSSLISDDLRPYHQYIKKFICKKPTVFSFFREFSRAATNMSEDLPKLMTKKNIAIYDFTLVMSDDLSGKNQLDVFFKYYEEELLKKGIVIQDYCMTAHGDTSFFVIRDKMNNIYRLFLKSEYQYMKYRIGDIVDTSRTLDLPDVDDTDPRDTYRDKIKVFDRSGNARYIDAEATVLDFAFMIHSEIGFHFKYAFIDNSQAQLPAYTRLNDGDTITIVTDEEETVSINWFNYAKTSKATSCLVKHFSKILN